MAETIGFDGVPEDVSSREGGGGEVHGGVDVSSNSSSSSSIPLFSSEDRHWMKRKEILESHGSNQEDQQQILVGARYSFHTNINIP